MLSAGVFNNETAAQFTQEIVHVIFFTSRLDKHEQFGLAYVQKYMPCLSKNRIDSQLLIIHVFSVFTIKRPRALAALAPLIEKTPTNVL